MRFVIEGIVLGGLSKYTCDVGIFRSSVKPSMVLAIALAGCGSGEAHETPGNGTAGSGSVADGAAGGSASESGGVDLSGCGDSIVDPASGAVRPEEYRRQSKLWDRASIDCRLGPRFTALHPGDNDDRPTAFEPEHKTADQGYLCKKYELGTFGSGG